MGGVNCVCATSTNMGGLEVGLSRGTLIHIDPLENPKKIDGGVGLSHYDNTTLIVYETGL
jgi:hypothetical protein